MDEGERQFSRVLGRALEANLRYNAVLGELTVRAFDLLVSAVSEIRPHIISDTAGKQEAKSKTVAHTHAATPTVPSPAPILLEGKAGDRAFGLFVVENNLSQKISARLEVGRVVGPGGSEIKPVVRFTPGVITLATQEQVVAKVTVHISSKLVADMRYQGEILVPGIPGARIPIVIRRKPSNNSRTTAKRGERASSISKRR